jgi:hypothetical protein
VYATGESDNDEVDAEGESDDEMSKAESGTGYITVAMKRMRKKRGSNNRGSSKAPAQKKGKIV